MSLNELKGVFESLRQSLDMIETGLDQENLPRESLEDFKVAVDMVRTDLLAVLGGVPAYGHQEHLGSLRVHRASQLCANVHADLALGTIEAGSQYLEEFAEVATAVLERTGQLTGRTETERYMAGLPDIEG